MYLALSLSLSSFVDPGPHGTGRYSEHMLPEVEKKDFRKGSQVHSWIYVETCGWRTFVNLFTGVSYKPAYIINRSANC